MASFLREMGHADVALQLLNAIISSYVTTLSTFPLASLVPLCLTSSFSCRLLFSPFPPAHSIFPCVLVSLSRCLLFTLSRCLLFTLSRCLLFTLSPCFLQACNGYCSFCLEFTMGRIALHNNEELSKNKREALVNLFLEKALTLESLASYQEAQECKSDVFSVCWLLV